METVTSRDGTSIAYDQYGQGPALIIVTGASATRADAAAQAAALALDFTVYAYDRRGRGDSGDTQPYAVEREVEDIAALAAATGGPVYLLGHSSGAILALDATRLLPDTIAKLAVYEPPLIIDDSRSPMPPNYVQHLKDMLAEGRRGDIAATFMAFVGTPERMIEGMRQSPMWPHMEAVAPSLIYDAMVCEDVEQGVAAPLQKWAAIQTPTLILDGTALMGNAEAHTFLRNGADALARVLPHSRRQTLDGQDHGPTNDALVPALQAFFLNPTR